MLFKKARKEKDAEMEAREEAKEAIATMLQELSEEMVAISEVAIKTGLFETKEIEDMINKFLNEKGEKLRDMDPEEILIERKMDLAAKAAARAAEEMLWG